MRSFGKNTGNSHSIENSHSSHVHLGNKLERVMRLDENSDGSVRKSLLKSK